MMCCTVAIQHRQAAKASALREVGVDALRISDASDWLRAGIDLLGDLVGALRADRVRFLVPRRRQGWDRTAFLNLTFWNPGGGELLESTNVTADQLAHVAWHHLAARRLGSRSVDAVLLAEAIASAFDLYAMGRMLVRAPRAAFLASQAPRLAERAADAGLSAAGFERLLVRMAADPQRAFEDLRQLLYDAARALAPVATLPAAAAVAARFDDHPFAPLLHHYELSNWILHARAGAMRRPSRRAAALDAALRRSPTPVATLLAALRKASA
jgi:hypothetical protein